MLLSELHEEGLLKDKLFIFGGDHGNRFTWSRTSLGGRYEERMPFISISLPEDSDPKWRDNLNSNQDKLVSNFDIHLTIKRLLNSSYEPESTQRSPISVVDEIPSNRTCAEAGVPEYYCVCIPETYLPIRSEVVQNAARSLLKKINHIVAPFRNICEIHRQNKILEARRLQSESQRVRIVLETMHGSMFEGLISSNGEEVIGDINRLDWAGETVKCMEYNWKQLFCHCKPEKDNIQTLFANYEASESED